MFHSIPSIAYYSFVYATAEKSQCFKIYKFERRAAEEEEEEETKMGIRETVIRNI